ncbi:hypothetical protein BOH66_01185 [Microbacterium aurum]|uniref:WYL domain-containing protein n=1 Tax=Microbacterium aurum TaxID=36805 RepID=A0A1P8U4N4_9MICO|nr:hypothetical protein BOH66_01185 [Microbacterium aurum]MBM7826621.1 hypothetical protein [Microbacterium aurum]
MELENHADIVRAIRDLSEVTVTFRSKEDGGARLVRRCAPMDYAASSRAHDKTPRYHFWDFESDSAANHVLSLPASQIESVEVLDTSFDPSSFVTWPTKWAVQRESWGEFN